MGKPTGINRSRSQFAKCRTGFTLVELLVVIAIIGVLAAVLLPAVQAARESARRIECTNHLKQLGIALHGHHDVYRRFPIGRWREWNADPTLRELRGTTLTYLLPFIEQQELYDSYDFNENIITYQLLRGSKDRIGLQKIPVFTCPSDNYGRKSSHNGAGVNNYASSAGGRWLNSPSRSNCECVHGLTRTYFDPLRGSGVLPKLTTTGPFNDRYYRQDGHRREIPESRFADIQDGTSNTIFMGEILVGSRIWLDRGWGDETHNGCGSTTTIVPINFRTSGTQADVDNGLDGCNANCNANFSFGFRSNHAQVANFVLGDGSCRFIDENIDHWTYQYLGAIRDGNATGPF